MSGLWMRMREYLGLSTPSQSEQNKGGYAMVSRSDPIQVLSRCWWNLPAEIKANPELEPLNKYYQEQNGSLERADEERRLGNSNHSGARSVNSASTIRDPESFSPGTPLQRESQTKMDIARHCVKMALFLACWLFVTVVFVLYGVKKDAVINTNAGAVYSVFLLCGLLVLIIFDVMNRTISAIVMAALTLAVLALIGERQGQTKIISWMDVENLVMHFSMMILQFILTKTGIFNTLTFYTFKVTKGRLWPLIFLLCTITTLLSTFLENDAAVLLMSPIPIGLSKVTDLDPVPILIFMAFFSNIGGIVTPLGDPPGATVTFNEAVTAAGINFMNYTAHMALGSAVVFIQTSLQFLWKYRDTSKLRLNEPKDIQELRYLISIWRQASKVINREMTILPYQIDQAICQLEENLQLRLKEVSGLACPPEQYEDKLHELEAKCKITNKGLLAKACVVICFDVSFFFLHYLPEFNHVSPSCTALLGTILLLDHEDLETILQEVKWSTLLFFGAHFVFIEALSKLGLISSIGGLMEQLISWVDESCRLPVAILLNLWVSAMMSLFLDNIPLTHMMLKVVISISNNPALRLPLPPLVYAMQWGVCLGGNGMLLGASANVVSAEVAEEHGHELTFMRFLKDGLSITVVQLLVITPYLLICHCVFGWH